MYRIGIMLRHCGGWPPQIDEHHRISARWMLCCAERRMKGQKGGPQVDWNIGLMSIKCLLLSISNLKRACLGFRKKHVPWRHPRHSNISLRLGKISARIWPKMRRHPNTSPAGLAGCAIDDKACPMLLWMIQTRSSGGGGRSQTSSAVAAVKSDLKR